MTLGSAEVLQFKAVKVVASLVGHHTLCSVVPLLSLECNVLAHQSRVLVGQNDKKFHSLATPVSSLSLSLSLSFFLSLSFSLSYLPLIAANTTQKQQNGATIITEMIEDLFLI